MSVRREAAVAGLFYPDRKNRLREQVEQLLQRATDAGPDRAPHAIVVPHAGYRYSGDIAAQSYVRLRRWRDHYRRVLLLGPCHGLPFEGLALSSAEAFQTPLGDIPVDRQGCDELLGLPGVQVLDQAHAREHSLEVQLPFLQSVLGDFSLIPVAVGSAAPERVAAVIEHFWEDPHTLVVISTDLSHFLDQRSAETLDQRTREAIESLDYDAIAFDQACGRNPLRGLLAVLRHRGLPIDTLAMGTSARASGDPSRVVGYGTWVVQ